MHIYSLKIKPAKPIALQQHDPIIITIIKNGVPRMPKIKINGMLKYKGKW